MPMTAWNVKLFDFKLIRLRESRMKESGLNSIIYLIVFFVKSGRFQKTILMILLIIC